MKTNKASAEGLCDRCGNAPVVDATACVCCAERWLCLSCMRIKQVPAAYTVKRPDGAAWVAHLMELRARALARKSLFPATNSARTKQEAV